MPERHQRVLCLAAAAAACALAGPAPANPLEEALRRAAEKALQKALTPPPAPPAAPPVAPQPAPAPPAAPAAVDPARPAAADEQRHVAPRATERVAAVPLRTRQDGNLAPKFSAAPGKPEVTLSNPYLDPAGTVLSLPTSMACTADGALVVGGEGGIDARQRPVAVGYWRVAADGAVTPLHTRPWASPASEGPCDVAYGRTGLLATRPAVLADGSLVVGWGEALLRVDPDGVVRRLAGSPGSCRRDRSPDVAGLADGGPDEARFKDIGAVAAGADGEVWVVDQKGCALRRVDRDGFTRTVLGPAQVCAPGTAAADALTLQRIVWDAQRGELVSGGSFLTSNQLTTTVWRIRPDGQVRLVLLGQKLGASPAGAQLDGVDALALDPQGRLHIGSRRMPGGYKGNDQLAVLRVDEARGSVQPLTGAALVAGLVHDDTPLDGAAERARFVKLRDLCFAPDGTLFVLDDRAVRRLDRTGQVSTWGF